jgi:hypothetical protein
MIKDLLETNLEELIVEQIRNNQKEKDIDIIEAILSLSEEHDMDIEEIVSTLSMDMINEIRVCAIKKRYVTSKFSKDYVEDLNLDQYNLMDEFNVKL